MSDPRHQHTADPRPSHSDASPTRHDTSGVLQSPPMEAFVAFLVEERRACYQRAASIERMLGMESAEQKLRKENAELRKQLNDRRR